MSFIAGYLLGLEDGGENAVIKPINISKNGTYTAADGVDGYSPIKVDVPPTGGGYSDIINQIKHWSVVDSVELAPGWEVKCLADIECDYPISLYELSYETSRTSGYIYLDALDMHPIVVCALIHNDVYVSVQAYGQITWREEYDSLGNITRTWRPTSCYKNGETAIDKLRLTVDFDIGYTLDFYDGSDITSNTYTTDPFFSANHSCLASELSPKGYAAAMSQFLKDVRSSS